MATTSTTADEHQAWQERNRSCGQVERLLRSAMASADLMHRAAVDEDEERLQDLRRRVLEDTKIVRRHLREIAGN